MNTVICRASGPADQLSTSCAERSSIQRQSPSSKLCGSSPSAHTTDFEPAEASTEQASRIRPCCSEACEGNDALPSARTTVMATRSNCNPRASISAALLHNAGTRRQRALSVQSSKAKNTNSRCSSGSQGPLASSAVHSDANSFSSSLYAGRSRWAIARAAANSACCASGRPRGAEADVAVGVVSAASAALRHCERTGSLCGLSQSGPVSTSADVVLTKPLHASSASPSWPNIQRPLNAS
mmetsp:Transcript_102689/g.331195  ORF Transcript_102689/g.331195 Transcript_102689/m.331195 type:complete len:240 (-) Transcript_102689:41-760(-)